MRALDWLGEQQLLEVKVAGVRHRYQRLRQPDSLQALAAELYQRGLARERAEIQRLQQVLELVTLDACQSNALAAHFGERRTQPCGHCGWCLRGKSELPPRRAPVIDEQILRAAEALRREQAQVLASPRLMARFLCGVTSPRLSRHKLGAHALFGSLQDVPFSEVMARLGSGDDRRAAG